MANETKKVVYPGPHPEIVLKNVPAEGEETSLVRGKTVDLPRAIAEDLVKRKKLKAVNETK